MSGRDPAQRPSVLLLHGFLSGSAAWTPLRKLLESEVTVLAPDLLGCGTARRGGAPVTIEAIVAHLAPMIAGERFCCVVGHSMGGIIALALARQFPAQFGRVAVVGLPIFDDDAAARSFLSERGLLHAALLREDRLSHAGCRVLHRLRRWWLPAAPVVAPRQPRVVIECAFDHSLAGHRDALRNVIFSGHVGILADQLDVPVSALHGERDRSAPLARVRELAMRYRWQLQVVAEGTHQLPVEQPELTARWLHDQIQQWSTCLARHETHSVCPAAGSVVRTAGTLFRGGGTA